MKKDSVMIIYICLTLWSKLGEGHRHWIEVTEEWEGKGQKKEKAYLPTIYEPLLSPHSQYHIRAETLRK